MLTDLIQCNYRFRKSNKSFMGIFSVDLDLFFSNILKEVFVPATSSSPSVKSIVYRSRDNSRDKTCIALCSNVNEKSLNMSYILNNT